MLVVKPNFPLSRLTATAINRRAIQVMVITAAKTSHGASGLPHTAGGGGAVTVGPLSDATPDEGTQQPRYDQGAMLRTNDADMARSRAATAICFQPMELSQAFIGRG